MNHILRHRFQVIALVIAMLNVSCASGQKKEDPMTDKEKPKYTNELIHESSPYLLQHAHNPVNWLPWGTAAFEKAKAEDKLVLVSIGYSSCHWCHVMEHESFEDEAVAKIMNDHFICIKVDREERPDVDQIYMNAVQLMTGSGGWPLNCFTLPDGRPVYGGTYFPKDQWTQVLQNLHYTYQKEKSKILEYADNLTQGVQQSELIEVKTDAVQFDREKLDEMMVNWKRGFDTIRGGNNRAPKFPMPNNYDFMMQYAWHTGDTASMNHVDLTLHKMAFGGIYDQVGGGFSRYSVDTLWKVPHFEKMLYDNAQLVSVYSHAYQRTRQALYKDVVYQTLEWVYREMSTKDGAFYSALDADSEGEEGKFYVWSEQELKTILGADFDFAKNYYNVNSYGLWEGHYILIRSESDAAFATKQNLTVEQVREKVKSINQKLLTERDKRIRPGLDDKSLTSWNALMITGFVDAYQAFGDELFLKGALMNAKWLVKNQLKKDNSLFHTYKNGESKIDGFLEDYCFTIEAFIKLYEVTFDETWIEKAEALTQYTIAHFYDEKSGMFFFTSVLSKDLIARKMEISDNVIPSTNSTMAKVLFKLGTLTANEDYISKSKQMLSNVYDGMEAYGSAYSNWGMLAMNMTYPYYEVAITGGNWKKLSAELNTYYQPNKVLMGGEKGELPLIQGKFGKISTIFVCVNKACQMPVQEVPQALLQMKSN
jgi:uncharacterized protein YyaL (SSP411 family)